MVIGQVYKEISFAYQLKEDDWLEELNFVYVMSGEVT